MVRRMDDLIFFLVQKKWYMYDIFYSGLKKFESLYSEKKINKEKCRIISYVIGISYEKQVIIVSVFFLGGGKYCSVKLI